MNRRDRNGREENGEGEWGRKACSLKRCQEKKAFCYKFSEVQLEGLGGEEEWDGYEWKRHLIRRVRMERFLKCRLLLLQMSSSYCIKVVKIKHESRTLL